MLTFFRKKTNPHRMMAESLYHRVVTQARQPFFYAELGVPDTVDGRFDMILMHIFVVMRYLRERGEGETAQALYDVMFVDMDRAIREMGIGDLSVKKHMHRMMKAFNGRLTSYDRAIGNREALIEALRRNIYGTVKGEVPFSTLDRLAEYLEDRIVQLPADMQDQMKARVAS